MSDVSNGPDWWQASDGKWYPPEQQPSVQSPAPPPPSRMSSSTSNKSAFAFDMKRWSQPERVTAIATLVLLIFLFLPWQSVKLPGGSYDFNGLWHGWMYLVLLLCLAILVYLVAKAGYTVMPFKLPLPEEQLLLFATAINLVLTVLAFLLKPGGYGINGVGWSFGSFVALAAAIIAAAPLGVPAIKAHRA